MNPVFGVGDGLILYEDVRCIGNETVLQQCSHTLTNSSLIQFGSVGVRCNARGKYVAIPSCKYSNLLVIVSHYGISVVLFFNHRFA